MENGPLTLGLEDGTIDVERLLVEPQDGHVSMDSVICFNEKNPENAMDMEDVSRSFGGSDTGIAHEQDDILNGEVLDAMPSEVEVGYFRLHDDFCGMREEYLLGVEFAESITNLDYGSTEGLQASDPNSQVQAFSAGSDTACNSDLFRIMETPDCQNDQFKFESPESSDIPSCHDETLVNEKPSSSTLQNIGKSCNSSTGSFQDILSDENGGELSPSREMFCCPKTEKNNGFELIGQDGETKTFQGQEVSATMSVQASSIDGPPTRKRSRKPTQRYIDELADPISTYSKRRHEVSSSTVKNKSPGTKGHKKCHMGSKAIGFPVEESSVKAIQVPFGSLVEGHAYNMEQHADRRNSMTMSKSKHVTLENQKKRDECLTAVYLKKRDDGATNQMKKDECVTAAYLKKRGVRTTAAHQKKKNDHIVAVSPKKRDDGLVAVSVNKRDERLTAANQKKREDYLTAESTEEVSGRRKHHRLWTISEIRKLIDGVAQYGVGRWSRIKKLFFSTSAHRTSVDLKDKWRNLLKASGILEPRNQQGEKKRNVAWRPLPKSILRRVCELNALYPYPKGQRTKIAHIHHDSSDKSTDLTLNDYRRILRSINGN